MKKRISFEKKTFINIFIISSILVFVSVYFYLPNLFFNVEKKVVNVNMEEDVKKEVLGATILSSLTPTSSATPIPTNTATPTIIPTIIVLPTSTPDSPNNSASGDGGNNSNQSNPTPTSYSGTPLPTPNDKRQIFSLSDSFPDTEDILVNEKISLVEGKMGRGFQIEPGGKLIINFHEAVANSGTLSFWLKIEPDGDTSEFPIIVWNYGGSGYSFVYEVSYAQPYLIFSVYDKSGEYQNGIEAEFIDFSNWHKVVVTWDLTNNPYKRAIYMDDKKLVEESMPFAPEVNNNGYIQIGGDLRGGSGKTVTIDEVAVFNWAKGEEEIINQ